jgi:hypothetical protein
LAIAWAAKRLRFAAHAFSKPPMGMPWAGPWLAGFLAIAYLYAA